MVFSSITFLFYFLPIFLLIFNLLKFSTKLQFLFLLVSGIFFYFWGENFKIWIMLTTTTIDYFCGLLIVNGFKRSNPTRLVEGGKKSNYQKFWLTISILSNLTLLGYFKYYNFFYENIIGVLNSFNLCHYNLNNFVKVSLPLGISFYTFQSMSYTIDVYRGHVSANRSLFKFATFVTMFPQLIAGPIVRYSQIESQMNNLKINSDNFVIGIKRFIIGLSKKVLIANTLAPIVDKIFTLPASELSTGLAWLGIITYILQLYYDFSGYSCMAIGLGRMIGFTFPENFNYPLISKSIREFWQRWHITLSSWFRDYLFIPLGGSRSGEFKTYRNLLIVFITCGLWHGASWNFLIWGLSNGFFLVLERMSFIKRLNKIPKLFSHLYMFLVLNLTFVIFRTENISDSVRYLSVLFGKSKIQTSFNSIIELVQLNVLVALIVAIIFSTPIFLIIIKKIDNQNFKIKYSFNLLYLVFLVFLFIVSTMSLSSGTCNPFIYFRF